MNHVLLLGAGFTYNWGGWLASEVFEHLLGVESLDADTRRLLWKTKDRGGFEAALAELQAAAGRRGHSPQLDALQSAILDLFNRMNPALATAAVKAEFEPLIPFFRRFDAIFTTNQDLLVEHHYPDAHLGPTGRWAGWRCPGTQFVGGDPKDRARAAVPTPPPFDLVANIQPYIKLHGSSNLKDDLGRPLIAMGGNKPGTIGSHPLLAWYHQKFKQCLEQPDTRLMVIGYSFSDPHIDDVILAAAKRHGCRIFIMDPRGVDVLNKYPNAAIPVPAHALTDFIIGGSRRSIRSTFGADQVERDKVMRFFRG